MNNEKFSYSKLNTYESCGWKYYLTYKKGHYTFSDNLTTEFGVLLHWVEECIGRNLKEGKSIDYEKLKKEFYEINIPKTSKYDTKGGIYGVNILKEKYKEDFYKPNDNGQSYATKAEDYVNFGIYRLEKWLQANPDYEVYDLEKFFSVTFNNEILSGYIDRIFYNKKENSYIIEDIKTKDKPFKDEELTTPMQFVVYYLALKNIVDDEDIKVSFFYDLPILGIKQEACTKGYQKRGIAKLEKIFNGINNGEFIPGPSPLCYFCSFCYNNPNASSDSKYLCPYYSQWTYDNKKFTVENKCSGMEEAQVLQHNHEIKKRQEDACKDFDFDF